MKILVLKKQNENILSNKNYIKKSLNNFQSNFKTLNLNFKNFIVEENFYIQNIFDYLTTLKVNNSNYLNNFNLIQNEINVNMRKILIEWIINIFLKFKLGFKILFLAINLIDTYIQNKLIKKNKFQLLGITCLYVACKYEMIHPPNLKYFVILCDGAYSKENVIKMESKILKSINFNLNLNLIYELLVNYKFYYNLTDTQFHISLMIYLINIYKTKYFNINPNNYCLSLIFASSKIVKNDNLLTIINENKNNKILGSKFLNDWNNNEFKENCIITKIFINEEYFKIGYLKNNKLIFN